MEKGGGCGEAAAAAAGSCINPELEGLERELQAVVGAGQADAFLLYLLGMVLLDRWVGGWVGMGGHGWVGW